MDTQMLMDLLSQSPIVAALVWVVLGMRKDRDKEAGRHEKREERSAAVTEKLTDAVKDNTVIMAEVKTVVQRLNGGGR